MVINNITKRIDDLFLTKKTYPLIKLEDNINNIKDFRIPLNEQLKNIKELNTLIEDDISRLNNLNSQIESLNNKNLKLELEINNKTMIYKELKELLMKIEVKPKYYVILEELEIKKENIEKFEIAIYKTKYLKEKLKLEVVEKRNENCKKFRAIFSKRFKIFFISLLKELIILELKNKKNKADLKINSNIYAGLKVYSGLFINKLELRTIYSNEMSKLFYSNFKFFFRTLTDSFKDIIDDFCDNLKNVFKSVLLICECEIEFIYTVFLEKDEISLNEEINVVFGEAIPLFFIFLEEIFIINELKTLKGIQEITNNEEFIKTEHKQVNKNKSDDENKDTEDKKKKVVKVEQIALNEFRNSILSDLKRKYDSFELQYSKKLMKEFSNIQIRNSCFEARKFFIVSRNEDLKKELIDFLIEKIKIYTIGKETKIENVMEKFVCLNIISKEDKSIYKGIFVEVEKLFIELVENNETIKIKSAVNKIRGIEDKEIKIKLKNSLRDHVAENKKLKGEFKWLFV